MAPKESSDLISAGDAISCNWRPVCDIKETDKVLELDIPKPHNQQIRHKVTIKSTPMEPK